MYFGDFSDYSLTLLLDSSLICFIFGVLHFTAGDHTLIYLTLSYYCDYLVIELNIPKGALLEVIARLLKPAVSVLALRLCEFTARGVVISSWIIYAGGCYLSSGESVVGSVLSRSAHWEKGRCERAVWKLSDVSPSLY
jgi:hypothetical protein